MNCPYTLRYNFVPHLSGNRYKAAFTGLRVVFSLAKVDLTTPRLKIKVLGEYNSVLHNGKLVTIGESECRR
jgi:hypothetical protein